MNEQQILERFFRVADKGERHPYYSRTTELATLYRTLVTGDGMDQLMRRFTRRESEAQFRQRQEITQHITSAVVENILDVFRKVPRSNVRRELSYNGGNSDAKKAELEGALSTFWGGDKSADDWCALRLLELNSTDPNAWVVLEWADYDYRYDTAHPYPFEVSSHNALDYKHDERGELLYLIARSVSVYGAGLERLTLYQRTRHISLDQLPPGETRADAVTYAGKVYVVTEHPPHGLDFVPAFRIGYKRDQFTEGHTFVSPYHSAVPYLMNTIKSKSELDLTAALHAFPLVIRVAEDCDEPGCNGGEIETYEPGKPAQRHTCARCNGTGKRKPTTTQEEILVSAPSSPDGLVDLEKLLVYKTPPVEIIEWQERYVEALTRKAKQAVFNTDIFSRAEIAETATSKVIDLQNVYDTLFPFARRFAEAWEWIVGGVAKITSRDADLYVRMLVQRDFKLKSFDDLLDDLKAANDTGASPAVRQYLNTDIARAMFADEPQAFMRWQVRERFNPFSGQRDENILLFLAGNLVPPAKKVLYANLGSIFDELETEYAGQGIDFYQLEYTRQKAAVDEKVQSLMQQTAAAAPILNG